MLGFITSLGTLLLIFSLWASFFDGALKEVRTTNPDYEHPNKHFDEIVDVYNTWPTDEDGGRGDYWNRYIVEMCSLHMPNWEKTLRCVHVRRYCQYEAPIEDRGTMFEHYDVFSEQYGACVENDRPSLGTAEYLRAGRGLLRIAVAFPFLYAGQRLGADQDTFFFGSLARWMEHGR